MEKRRTLELLKSVLDQQEQMLQLIEELAKEAFGEKDGRYVFNHIMEYYDHFEENGCMPSLCCLWTNLEESKKREEEWQKKREKMEAMTKE